MKYNENDILRRKFALNGFTSVAEMIRATKSQLTEETYSRILSTKRDKRADLRTLLIMAAELGFSNDEIATLCRKRGEDAIARLISPAPLTVEEGKMLDKIVALGRSKFQLINDLLDNLAR